MSGDLDNLQRPTKVLIDTENFSLRDRDESRRGGIKIVTCQNRYPERKELSLLQKENSGHS